MPKEIKSREVDTVRLNTPEFNVQIRLYDGENLEAVISYDSVRKLRRLYESLGNIILNYSEDMDESSIQ